MLRKLMLLGCVAGLLAATVAFKAVSARSLPDGELACISGGACPCTLAGTRSCKPAYVADIDCFTLGIGASCWYCSVTTGYWDYCVCGVDQIAKVVSTTSCGMTIVGTCQKWGSYFICANGFLTAITCPSSILQPC